ncbi:MAG: DUF4093 domain-containing protein [Clostridia bacterium]|nr:DUF4093 domain-containing protein [Clostridia bacterium]
MAEREKLNVPYPVIVEGRYDKARLSGVIEAEILTTAGFGIFSKKEQLSLIRALAEPRGVIVLTDSDGAGKLIRSHLSSALPKEKVFHLYIPEIKGKERRKSAPSKAGTLGVEGMEDALLYELFLPFADADAPVRRGGITKTDLFTLGLTGAEDAAARRDTLAQALGLPTGMTPNALLGAVNILYAREEFAVRAREILQPEGKE